jgi:hypothetical protein
VWNFGWNGTDILHTFYVKTSYIYGDIYRLPRKYKKWEGKYKQLYMYQDLNVLTTYYLSLINIS